MNNRSIKFIGAIALQIGVMLPVALQAFVADPVVNVSGLATAQQTLSVTVTDVTPGATITYTTDGSNPSMSSASIASGGSLSISQNTALKVQAFLSSTNTSNLVITQCTVNGMVSAGASHTLALTNDGTVWAWGDNSAGELGNGNTTPSSQPVQVMTSSGRLTGVVAVAADNDASFAVDNNGNVWAWGLNTNGQLAIGTTSNSTVAVQVPGLNGIVAIATNQNHTLAVKSDGSVWGWGANTSGQVGNGIATSWVIQPTQVVAPSGQSGYLQGILAVAAGAAHSLALDKSGHVWAWGGDASGQLGNGDSTLATQPAPVQATVGGSAFSGAVALAAGTANSFAMKNDGSIWAWGDNTIGELGNGTTNPSSPVTVANLSPAQVNTLVGAMMAVGNQSALRNDGTVWIWGDNTADRLAISTAGSYYSWPLSVSLADGVTAVANFNGDTNPDYFLFNVSTLQTAFWYMNGATHQSSVYGPTLPAGWSVAAVADFNGDGNPDFVVFDASTLQTGLWYMNGPTHTSSVYGPTLPAGWTVAGVADFNGDGMLDFLLFDALTRQTAIWYMNGPVHMSGVYGPTLPAGWAIAAVADFDGDGNPDYFLFNASTLQTAIWYMNGPTHMSSVYGPTLPAGWAVSGAAYFSWDPYNMGTKPDLVLFNASTGQTAIWYMTNTVHNGGVYGPTLPSGW